ncbi:MAG: sigma-70 family RNA polymerase sigma factor [Gammaproteobacteria bacterium]|nr:sigma-70 family RNA polymerase sigma factor [Gammaproteobacteria bacterium]
MSVARALSAPRPATATLYGGRSGTFGTLILIEGIDLSRPIASRKDNIVSLASRERPERRRLVEQLFDEHARALRLFLMGWSVPQDQVDDLVQELFTRLMGVDGLEQKMSARTGSNRSYLLTMANNMIVDRQRKSQVRKAYLAEQREIEPRRMDERTPERIVAAQLELEAMRSVIRNMRLNWRVAFVLQRFGNMSYEDIAIHMGVTVRQVERYMVRAMRRIREERRKIEAAGET